ncbi:lipoprotein NlpI [Vibrio sp. SCSIO 43137]|uniref:lipoprotein NlpI n=1 Tax=Vibrio sp. SCSIO 43137 TaxID=3021011 RepID=UPI002307AA33|nr:lipoprotein NlpI [Vibrio sp. SCSIO 43137]WCE29162.1 lipoprotein NlpI [Vibrio sp. SCSIO 43137]
MRWLKFAALSIPLFLSGCVINKYEPYAPPMVTPLQANDQQEFQIARLSQLLSRQDLTDDVRAKMFYERGIHYDSLGLRDLARLDFNYSLSLNPAQPEIFNMLGVYFTGKRNYDAAYEAFNSTLELDPDNQYAERNQAIALYYGGRLELALEEITKHYSDNPEDPFRSLWLYIIEFEGNQEKARAKLEKNYKERSDEWGWVLVAAMLEDISEPELFNNIFKSSPDRLVIAQRLTEAYFYLAKRYQLEGKLREAESFYNLAIAFNIYDYVEHRYAFLELSKVQSEIRREREKRKAK